jgi:hypothetical protein
MLILLICKAMKNILPEVEFYKYKYKYMEHR